MAVDEGSNVSSASGDVAIDAWPDHLIGEEREEALDLVEPWRTGRGQMHVPARANTFLPIFKI